jgi:hypothetical protein
VPMVLQQRAQRGLIRTETDNDRVDAGGL